MNFENRTKERSFNSYAGTDPGWGTAARRAMFRAACKYLSMDPDRVENIFMVGVHSMLQSDAICLSGNSLDKVKNDNALLKGQEKLINEIKKDHRYKVRSFRNNRTENIPTQLGGQRAKGEMWKQALEFWKWTDEYSATWDMAFNELTWTVRSVNIKCDYQVDIDGNITFQYWFSDTLDLRPSWGSRSMEYNAICTVLGFLYHDVLGGSDELQVQAYWSTTISR
jgi:hypothetical protein